MGTWLPIEMAPRNEADAEAILVCDNRVHGGFHQVVFWDSEVGNDFKWATSDGPNFHKDAFTHFQPIDAPPPLITPS